MRGWGEDGVCEEGESDTQGFKYEGKIFMFLGFCPENPEFKMRNRVSGRLRPGPALGNAVKQIRHGWDLSYFSGAFPPPPTPAT